MRLVEIDALGNKIKFPTSKMVTTAKQLSGNKRDMRKKFIKSDYSTYSRIRKAGDGMKAQSSSFEGIQEQEVQQPNRITERMQYNMSQEQTPLSNIKSYDQINQELQQTQAPQPQTRKPVLTKPNIPKSFNGFNVDLAVDYLTKNAKNASTGYCARSVRLALEYGGIRMPKNPQHAYLYNNYLGSMGFKQILQSGYTGNSLPENYTPQKGDIIVVSANKNHPSGHISMYNGEQWISDFKQRTFHGLKDGYEQYTIWRHV